MLEVLRNAWKVKDLRKKILYTLLLLLVYRLASFIAMPGINPDLFRESIQGNQLLGLMDVFNGGALSNFTLLATGITPYITASIVVQLLTMAIPKLEAMSKEGAEGQKKISKITRYVGVVLAFIQAVSIVWSMSYQHTGSVMYPTWYYYAFVGIIQAAGTAFTMWMGEHITEKGIGNGTSLLIFINIISRLPQLLFSGLGGGANGPWLMLLIGVLALAIVVGVVFVDLGERRFPVQYAKRMVGRKMYGGQSTHIPMKVSGSGVMPLIFAMTFVQFPGMIINMFWSNSAFAVGYATVMGTGKWLNGVLTALFILFFTYFYATIAFNTTEISKNLQQHGGFIPGIRPGKPTSDFLSRSSNRISLFNAIYLALLATVPTIIAAYTGSNSPFGATSVLIVVSVALETSRQLESHLMMRHYRGFLN